MARVALVLGHSRGAPGARLLQTAIHEWHWNAELLPRLRDELAARGVEALAFERLDGSYETAMRQLCDAINATNPDLVVELHFNGGTQSGAEVLHWPGSARGREAAERLSQAVADAIGIRNRGAVAQARSWATAELVDGHLVPAGPPLWILCLTRAPAVIVEPFFGGNPVEAHKATAARDSGELPRAMADTIAGLLTEWAA